MPNLTPDQRVIASSVERFQCALDEMATFVEYDPENVVGVAYESLEVINEALVELRRELAIIVKIPSTRTLLLNAEARAMYEIAKRALEHS